MKDGNKEQENRGNGRKRLEDKKTGEGETGVDVITEERGTKSAG